MDYGQVIDDVDLSPQTPGPPPENTTGRKVIYQLFYEYFNNPTMIKIKDVGGFSMYMSKTYCLLSKECRYLVAFIPSDGAALKTPQQLQNLRWESFQTRTMEDRHILPPHHYTATRNTPLMAQIKRESLTGQASTYSCEKFPIVITLLHKKSDNEYQDTGTVVSALETYETIITHA